jgi:hypothetical protein
MMLAASLAWATDAAAQRGGGGGGGRGGGGGQPSGGGRGGGGAVSRPSGGQPATGHATPRPGGPVGGGGHYGGGNRPNYGGGYRPYYGGGYRPYYGYGYRGYYGYYSPYYWGAGWGWGWGASFGWGYPYYGYGGYGYPSYGYGGYGYPYYFDPSVDLRIEVTPRDAEVYLDGYLVGVVDNFDGTFQRLRVPYGEHEVTIYFNGYKSIGQQMLFRPGESYRIKQAMLPLQAGEPADPRPQPTSPPPQRDDRGYPPMRGYAEPSVGGGNEPQMPRRGQPDMPPPGEARGDFGTLAIRVQPAGAEILIDGERWETPAGDDRLTVDLAEGNHRLEIRKEGYKPYTSDVHIARGRTWPLNVSLPKSN